MISKNWIIGGVIALVVLTLGIMYMNTQSKWNVQNNAVDAVFQRQKTAHDEMWKVIKTQFGLKDDVRAQFDNLVNTWGERSKSQSGAQWLWVQESMPNLSGSTDFYKQIAQTVENQNGKFTSIRNDVVTVTNAYNDFVTNPWNQLFLFGSQENKRTFDIITSGVTNEAARTKEDNLEWMENNKK